MKVAALQIDIVWETPGRNFDRLESKIAAARATGARLVVLPEMYATGFSMATERIEEPPGGPSERFLREQAARHDLWVCGSIPTRGPGSDKPRNTLHLMGPAAEHHTYEKIHPFTFAREHEHYDAGSEFLTVTIDGVRTTFFICYDLRFADEFWAVASDTDCYVVVANWPARRREHWTTLLRARAIENQTYVVGVNRVGTGGGPNPIDYCGDSRIIDPWGEILAASTGVETMLTADIDAQVVRRAREVFPVLPDRR